MNTPFIATALSKIYYVSLVQRRAKVLHFLASHAPRLSHVVIIADENVTTVDENVMSVGENMPIPSTIHQYMLIT